jgi:xylulokinase
MTGTYRLGLDLGTSAVKALAVDATGRAVAAAQAPFPTLATADGQAEQAPADWLAAVAAATAMIGGELGAGWTAQVTAVGLAGQLPTLVCLGAQGPLGPAITWADARADPWAAAILDEGKRERLYRQTGMPIDGRYLAPMFRFHWHSRRAQVRRIMSAKDYLCHALTGALATDPATAAGYGVYALDEGRWDGELCALWDLDVALLPEIRPASAAAGPLHEAGAALLGLPEGVPVSVGTADSVAGALAMGGPPPGTVAIQLGSSAVVIDAAPQPSLDPGRRFLVTPHAVTGWFAREMDVLAAGSGFSWLAALLGTTTEDLSARAARSPPGTRGLYFAPYVAGGEQGALWRPELRGALHGLGMQHGRGDIARAFLEGTLYEIRRCVEVLAETTAVERIVTAGNMVAHGSTLAMMADIIDRPVMRFTGGSPAALGAALLTTMAPTPGTMPATTVPGAPVMPGTATAAYDALYGQYKALFPRIALPAGPD